MHDEKVVPADADGPRAVELAEDAVLQFHGGVTGVIRGASVGFSLLVHSLANVNGAVTGKAADGSEYVVDQVAPMTKHVDDDAPPVLLAVVPAGSLGGLGRIMAGEYPVPELAPHGKNLTEEPLVDEGLELEDAG